MTDANSGCSTDRTPSLRGLTALLGSHRRSQLTDVGLILGNIAPDRLHGEHTSLSIAAHECPSTTATHPSAVIGRGEAARLLLDLFEDVPDYLLEHVDHRGREHRPVRGDERLRCDLFLVAADRTLFGGQPHRAVHPDRRHRRNGLDHRRTIRRPTESSRYSDKRSRETRTAPPLTLHDAVGLSVCPATSSRHRAQRLPGHLSDRQSTRAAEPANSRRQQRTCPVHRRAGRAVLLHFTAFPYRNEPIPAIWNQWLPLLVCARLLTCRCLGPRWFETENYGALPTRCRVRGPVDRRDLPTAGVGCQRRKPRSGLRDSMSTNGVNHSAGTRLTAPGCGLVSLSNNVSTSWSWNR